MSEYAKKARANWKAMADQDKEWDDGGRTVKMVSEFVPFCPCCQSYKTDDKHQNHCFLGHAEKRIAELESGIKQAMTDLIETGNCYELLSELVYGVNSE